MQPTLAAFNFKSLSNDQDGLSPSHWKKILTHVNSLQAWAPQKKRTVSILMAYPV